MSNNIPTLLNMSAQYTLDTRRMGRLAIFIFLLSSVFQNCICRRLNAEDATPSTKLRSGGFQKFPVEEDNAIYAAQKGTNPGGNQLNCGRPEVYHSPPRKGFAQTRIVGGTTAHYGAYPWQVEIQKYNRQDGHWEHRCGGTLVSDSHIVTAAHCLSGWEHEHFRVVVGDHHLDRTDDKEQIHPVKEWRVHPKFQDATPYSNDIAIIQLKKSVVMSSHVSPACLPTENTQRNPGTWCVVSGWGLTTAEQESSSANTLQAAAVPLIADDDCKSEKYYGEEIRAGMMCAGFEQGEVDACGNDSGGPLTCEIKGSHVLMGAVSWGRSCGKRNKPGVYSNVLHYIEWIHKAMGELKN